MKKITLLTLSLSSILTFAQTGSDNMAVSAQGEMFFMMGKKNISNGEVIDGVPYANGAEFVKVQIPNYNKSTPELRYNANKDEMEFKNGNDIYYVNKQPQIRIDFLSLKKSYECLNYSINDKDYFGYLVILVDNAKYSLYKKEFIEIIKGEKGSNPFVTDQNDFYSPVKNQYLLKKGNQFFRISKNTKELVKLFDNNPSHESYIKSNKIDLSKENDLIKFVKFANEQ
ncbi:hypothetical protein [Elizabethkingia anophelis]|uniref:hypothetical protein n=1 Tax=Elizabethkingia anophelis TaxID=1117645 RepID=UPI002011857B|nr:hypothetical protein [Elizabethkingia anophelis]EJC8061096.1 hypothetical protein [Elizabethkingia anophelis]MCL1641041.1 hypothetical protein [Elizabethkingia anophelis]MCL1646841.1 hypothetical protein [Elizabethkingia anophelis]MCT3927764.1 hypothetical protein [Elizabethkingia anophelis]MCT4034071.1 hypothetical protein [Elizabethkingia anophelis]